MSATQWNLSATHLNLNATQLNLSATELNLSTKWLNLSATQLNLSATPKNSLIQLISNSRPTSIKTSYSECEAIVVISQNIAHVVRNKGVLSNIALPQRYRKHNQSHKSDHNTSYILEQECQCWFRLPRKIHICAIRTFCHVVVVVTFYVVVKWEFKSVFQTKLTSVYHVIYT